MGVQHLFQNVYATVRRLGVVGQGCWEPAELGSRWMRSLRAVRMFSEEDNWWHRQQQLEYTRSQLVRVLSGANRVHMLEC